MNVAGPIPPLEKGVKGMKIGVIRHFYTRDEEADPVKLKRLLSDNITPTPFTS